MKKIIFTMAMMLGICGMGNAQKYFDKVKLTNTHDSISYAVGIILAQNFVDSEYSNLNPDAIGKAFRDVNANRTPLLDEDQAKELISSYSEKVEAEKEAKAKQAEKEFLENNLKNPGVKATESGLQYVVVKEGNGKKPTTDNSVKIHYEGKLTDGEVFDSDYENEEPTELDVDGVIDGLSEGLQLMSEGSEYIFYIPYELGYGSYSPGEFLPAYSTLIFTVELISVGEKSADDDEEGVSLDLKSLFDEE